MTHSTDTLWDIIPDLHGEAVRLEALLARLGYAERAGAFRHPDPARRAVFLGDFIDRGPGQARCLDIVRRMTREGSALAIMGNHEFNALLFHRRCPETGEPLRAHSAANIRQHSAFLSAFPEGDARRAALDWMASLPLVLDLGAFRVAHAAWLDDAVAVLEAHAEAGAPHRLTEDGIRAAGLSGHPLHGAVEALLKGPEADLPPGLSYRDADGTIRTRSRIAWWRRDAGSWRDIVASMPDPGILPDAPLPASLRAMLYPEDAPALFFGHYWLTGTPVLQAGNVLCLDYSVARGGPLLAYRHPGHPHRLDLGRILAV